MLVAENIAIPVLIDLPTDWTEQVEAVARHHQLVATAVSRLPSNKVTLSLQATAGIGSSEVRFREAVLAACDELTDFLAPATPTYEDRLAAAAIRIKEGQATKITGRELLGWFGASRRGARVVERIRSELARHGLATQPDFNSVWVDEPLVLTAERAPAPEPSEVTTTTVASGAASATPPSRPDPVHRIGRLEAANQLVVSVPPGTLIDVATTTMLLHDFSQLPILRGERDIKGAVTWQSIGRARAMGRACATVDDCSIDVGEVTADANLFDVIPMITSRDFVLVRGSDRRIQGIVTVSDLSLQFRHLSEPFLLLGQIENHLRALVRRAFSIEELRAATDPADTNRVIDDAADLTLGESVRLMEPPANWPKLHATFAREPFLHALRDVLRVRNDVMHFDPDPPEDSQLALLRNFAAFIEAAVG